MLKAKITYAIRNMRVRTILVGTNIPDSMTESVRDVWNSYETINVKQNQVT